jgi:hypothetical protein
MMVNRVMSKKVNNEVIEELWKDASPKLEAMRRRSRVYWEEIKAN